MELKFVVDIDDIKIKDFLELKGISRNMRSKVRVKENLFVNGNNVKNYYVLHLGDELVIKTIDKRNPNILNNETKLEILFEDDYLLIVNKMAGIASQPSRKHPTDNLISMVNYYYQVNNIENNIHLVNRLDFKTTGIVIIAKSGFIHHWMSQNILKKQYLCVVKGHLIPQMDTIDVPIRRIVEGDIRRGVFEDGQRSITNYKVLKEFTHTSLVEVVLITGRTHQIRVHFSYLGHPLVGENLYDNDEGELKLHCSLMKFIHPITKQFIIIEKKPNWEEINA